MAPAPEKLEQISRETANAATTTTSKAGVGAAAAAKPAAKAANGGGADAIAKPSTSTCTCSNAGTASKSPNKIELETDAPPDWEALIWEALQKKAAENGPKLKVEQIDEDDWRASLLFSIKGRDPQAATTYAVHVKRSVGKNKL